jgi:hypothetical protein
LPVVVLALADIHGDRPLSMATIHGDIGRPITTKKMGRNGDRDLCVAMRYQ